jgi:hypothetical protein
MVEPEIYRVLFPVLTDAEITSVRHEITMPIEYLRETA